MRRPFPRSTSSPTTPVRRQPGRRRARRRRPARPRRCSASRTGRTCPRRPSCCRRATPRPTTACASSRRSRELPFAGHPTLGTCHAWLEARRRAARDRDVIVQECARRAGRGPPDGDDGLAFAAPPLLRDGPGRGRPCVEPRGGAARHRAAANRRRRSGSTTGRAGWRCCSASAEAVLALRPGARRPRPRRRRPVPAGRAGGVRGARVLPEGRRDRRGPGDRQPQRLAGGVAARAPAGCARRTSRARAPRSAAPAACTSPGRDDDGTIWVGGGTVTCVSGEVDL